jgi:hypothetical protein
VPRVYVLCQVQSVPTVPKLCLRMCQTLVSMHSRSLQSKKTQSPQKTTAGGGKVAPRRGQHPEHPRTPDTRTAPQNAARESVPLLALPESSGPLMRGGGRQAKPPPPPQRLIDPGCNTKPRRRGLNEGSQSLAISIGFAGLWQVRHARRLCQVGR